MNQSINDLFKTVIGSYVYLQKNNVQKKKTVCAS